MDAWKSASDGFSSSSWFLRRKSDRCDPAEQWLDDHWKWWMQTCNRMWGCRPDPGVKESKRVRTAVGISIMRSDRSGCRFSYAIEWGVKHICVDPRCRKQSCASFETDVCHVWKLFWQKFGWQMISARKIRDREGSLMQLRRVTCLPDVSDKCDALCYSWNRMVIRRVGEELQW